jgi:uroporphyrinogen-III synthase
MSQRRTVLITRSADGAQTYGDFILARGYDVLYEPMLKIEAIDQALPDICGYDSLVFTSAHAIRFFCAQSQERDKRVFTVGDATAEVARESGFHRVLSAGGTAADLERLLAAQDAGRALYLRAADIAHPLSGVTDHVIYRACLAEDFSSACEQAIRAEQVMAALFFSARGARAFADIMGQKGLNSCVSGINSLCLSDEVLESVSVLPWQESRVAGRPDGEGMKRLLAGILKQ